MKPSLTGIPGRIVVSCLLLAFGPALGSAQDAFFYDGAKKCPLSEEKEWTAYELAPGSDPAAMEAEARKTGRNGKNRAAVLDPGRRLLAIPVADGAKAPRGALRKVRLFKNGNADPIMETRDLVVRFKPEIGPAKAKALLKPFKGSIVKPVGDFAPNAFIVSVPADASSIDAANALQLLPEVQYAQPDLIWPKVARFVPNDPFYSQQWHLNNPGGNGGTVGADIKAERAWEITRGDPNLVIAILDDGVATGHEDFAAGKFTGGWDFVSNDNDPQPAIPTDRHGTSCAGLAAASGNNGTGVSGVAPDCRIMPVRMLGSNSTPTMEAAAIAHAKNNGAWVISNSWGPADGTGASNPCPQIVNDAINDAADNGRGGKGCVILWAAGNGNESSDLDGYASHPKVLCVAATLRNDTRSPYSDFGNGVDICAPGGSQAGDMVTIDRMGSAGYNSGTNPNYNFGFNGTSSATPVAAGVAALLLSAEPNLTRLQVRQRLIDTADFIDTANVTYDGNGHNNWYGFGRVNAFQALAAGENTPPTLTVSVPSDNQVSAQIPVASGTASDSGYGIYQLHWWVFNRNTGKWWNPASSSWQNDSGDGGVIVPAGNSWSLPLPETGEGSFQLHIKAEDKAANESAFIVRNYDVDNTSPTLVISGPATGNHTSAPGSASGTATDGGSGVKEIRVALRNTTTDRWLKWSNTSWTGPAFTWADHVSLASGTTSWTKGLPALPEGSYELFVQALDNNDAPSAWTPRSFTIDGGDPVITFNGLSNQQPVFDFRSITGTVSEPATVTLRLTEVNPGGTDRYWTPSGWTTNAGEPATWMPADLSANTWHPHHILPGRLDTRYGSYIIEAKAVDQVNKQDLESLVLVRTATDSTEPDLAISSPVAGAVLTEPVLPAINGTASDLQSGVAGVSLYLMRAVPGGFTYWTGNGWSLNATELPAQSNGTTWSAPVTSGPMAWSLPSYGNLINGAWQLQVVARNGELPAGSRTVTVSFTMDYHPVYEFTAASYSDFEPGNDNRLWHNPANWEPYGVPGANDIALIRNNQSVTSDSSLTLYGLQMTSGVLGFSAGPGVNGTLTTTGKSEWADGTFGGIWEQNGTLLLNGSGDRWLAGNCQLRNAGTVTLSTGRIGGSGSCTVTNLAGATWIHSGSVDPFNNYNGGNQFINQGLLRHTAAADSEFNDWTFTLGGEIRREGTAVLVLRANSTVPAGTQFTGSGGFRVVAGTMSASGSFTNVAGTFQFADGTLSASAPLNLIGSYSWSGGSWSGNLTIPAGSDLSTTGPCQLDPAAVLNNSGTVHWTTPNPLTGIGNVTVNNLPGGVWRLESTGDAFANYNTGNVFNNQGRLEKTVAGETLLRHWTYSSPGEIKSGTGLLRIAANWSATAGSVLSGAGTLEMADGTWSFDGMITSTVTTLRFSGGTMSGGPAAKIQGNWTWSGGALSGSLEVPASCQLTFDGSSQLNPAATLVNKGNVIWQGTSPLQGIGNVAVTNAPGAVWQIAATGAPFSNYNGGNSFTNQGIFRRTATGGDVTLHSWTYNQAASFESTGGGDTIINAPLNLMEGSSFNGAGKFILANETWLKGACTFAGNIEHTGTLHGEAAGQIKGTLRWVAGGMDGIVKVANLAYLRLSSGNFRGLGPNSIIDCSGSLVWEGGELQAAGNSTLRLRAGAVMSVESAAPFTNYNGNNHLVIDDGASLLKTSAGDSIIYWAFDNDGSATVNNGLMILWGGGSSDGSFTGNAPGVLRFANGDHVLEGGATTAGNVEITGGSLLAGGNAGGRLHVKDGTAGGGVGGIFDFAAGSTWTGGVIQGQTRIPNGHSLTVSSPAGKEFATGAALEVQGLLQWDGGYPIQGHGSSTIDVKSNGIFRVTADGDLFANYNGGNRLLLAGGFEKTAGVLSTVVDEWAVEGNGIIRSLQGKIDFQTEVTLNAGTQFQGGGRTRFNSGNLYLRGASTILSNVMVEISGASVNGHADGTAAINGGLIEWSGGAINGVLTLNSNTTLSGTADKWLGGGAQLRNALSMTVGGSGTLMGWGNSRLINLPSGTLDCTGSAPFYNYNDGNKLVNEGTMVLGNPVARQTMHWAFQQTASGTLVMEIAGPNAAAPEFDSLLSHRAVELAGTLAVTKSGGYQPADGIGFDVLTGYGGVSGKFTTVLAPDLKVEYTAGAVTMRAITPGMTYGEWVTAEGLAGTNALATADPDGDGVENFLEYAFHTNPKQASAPPVTSSLVTVENEQWVTVHYRRWQDRTDAGIGYYPERSADLTTWSPGAVDEADPAAGFIAGSEGRRCRILRGAVKKDFLRVRVE